MRKIFPALGLLFALFATAPAFAQCAAVPALPDTERRTQYSVSGSTGPLAVNFQIYGDGTDYANWINVYVNNVLQGTGSYTVTSPTTILATGCRPITDAVVTFTTAQTGVVQIVGARRPRQTSQFPENRGVAARDLNQRLTDITANQRERWDAIQRTIQAPPGETLNLLPSAASRASTFPCFDSNGQLITCTGSPTGVTFVGGTINAPVYFGDGQPWIDIRAFGCVADNGVTDNTTCLQNAINSMETKYFSGAIYIPPSAGGYFCIKTAGGVTMHNPGMALVGASKLGSQLAACGIDTTVVTLAGTYQRMEHLQILGANAPGSPGPSGFASNHAAVVIASTAANVYFNDFKITGGSNAVEAIGGDSTLTNGTICCAYGLAVAYMHGPAGAAGSGGMWTRMSIDQGSGSLSMPSFPYTINAWTSGHAYTANSIVSNGAFLIQATVGGTSGGGAPTNANYGIDIPDGSVTWRLLSPTNYAGLLLDSGTLDSYFSQMDISGPYTNGVALTNSFATNAPTFFKCVQCLPSSFTNNGFFINAATAEVHLDQTTTAGGITAGSAGLDVTPAFTGKLHVNGGTFAGGTYGAILQGAAGATATLIGGWYKGATNGVLLNQSSAIVSGNQLSAPSATGLLATGTIDYYNIVNNICAARSTVCATDSGSGTHKTVSGNN